MESYVTPSSVVYHGMVLYGGVWCDIEWRYSGIVLHTMVWYWCGIVSYVTMVAVNMRISRLLHPITSIPCQTEISWAQLIEAKTELCHSIQSNRCIQSPEAQIKIG